MKPFILLLLFVSSSLYSYTIHVTDTFSSDKEEVISRLLDLQGSWVVDIRKELSPADLQQGFLIVRATSESMLELVDVKNAKILWVEEEGEFLGYLLLTDMREFFDLYVNSPIRTFDCHVNQVNFEQTLILNNTLYVRQIAIKKEAARFGVGTQLLDEAKRRSPSGLVAVVLTEPCENKASRTFFSKHGFSCIGYLNCVASSLWPAYQSAVYYYETLQD